MAVSERPGGDESSVAAPSARSTFPRIDDYAFVSDCHSLALIARDGSIEWAVFHRFDGRPVFARILDRDVGGYFQIAPTASETRVERRYLPGTNVLETTFTTPSGVVSLTDFLSVEPDPDQFGDAHLLGARHQIIRIVRGLAGSVEVSLTFKPRFEYGLTTPYVTFLADDLAMATGSADTLVIESEIAPFVRDDHGGLDASAVIEEGEERVITTTWSTPSRPDTDRTPHADALEQLATTVRFWQTWSAATRYEGPYRDAVERSALTLKGLTDGRTGAVVAAATTSLPESIGGGRNWDYRYTWVRDSTTLLNSLLMLGHDYECALFVKWIKNTTAGRASEIQIMYGIGGERILTETVLQHLTGYRGSRPVRIGNGAWDQSQLDTYGWLMASSWFAATHARDVDGGMDPHFVQFVHDVVEMAIERFDQPDHGLWEMRGEPQHFVFSKLMMWLATDIGVRLEERDQTHTVDLARWRQARDEMRRRIETEGVDPAGGHFTQAFGSSDLDASTLQLGNLGFLPPDDPRMLATIDAIEARLSDRGHIYRYRSADGLEGDEGSFVFCTLWMVTALARSGQVERARERLEMVLAHASDLGLLAEEIDPVSGELLGNFPQAFSHVGVINAALAIQLAERGEEPWLPAR